MHDKFPEAFAAADVVAQYDVIFILWGTEMAVYGVTVAPDLLDVLDAFDHAAPHLQAACLAAVGLAVS